MYSIAASSTANDILDLLDLEFHSHKTLPWFALDLLSSSDPCFAMFKLSWLSVFIFQESTPALSCINL